MAKIYCLYMNRGVFFWITAFLLDRESEDRVKILCISLDWYPGWDNTYRITTGKLGRRGFRIKWRRESEGVRERGREREVRDRNIMVILIQATVQCRILCHASVCVSRRYPSQEKKHLSCPRLFTLDRHDSKKLTITIIFPWWKIGFTPCLVH